MVWYQPYHRKNVITTQLCPTVVSHTTCGKGSLHSLMIQVMKQKACKVKCWKYLASLEACAERISCTVCRILHNQHHHNRGCYIQMVTSCGLQFSLVWYNGCCDVGLVLLILTNINNSSCFSHWALLLIYYFRSRQTLLSSQQTINET